MDFQKRYFYLFLLSCIVLTVFSGCNSLLYYNLKKVDLTKENFIEIKNELEGKPDDVQYYISNKITLKLSSPPVSVLTVDYLGNLVQYNWTVREQVIIPKKEKGKLLSDKNGYLLIGFEDNYPDYFIRFGQLPERNDGRYYLIFDDNQNYRITYGDGVYDVYCTDLPYLKIKKKELPLKYNNNRQVIGWPVFP